jgi:hypothetical protein
VAFSALVLGGRAVKVLQLNQQGSNKITHAAPSSAPSPAVSLPAVARDLEVRLAAVAVARPD